MELNYAAGKTQYIFVPGIPGAAHVGHAEILAPISLQGLAHQPRWVAWRNEQRNGDVTKIPIAARSGREAKSNDPATWATFGEAEFWCIENRGTGIGIILGPLADGGAILAGVDLDSCRDSKTGVLRPGHKK
jgi:primase-polymerase (primpol)-like protein